MGDDTHDQEDLDRQEALQKLAALPCLSPAQLQNVTVQRMGGLTNRNFKVVTQDATYVLRVPGEGTDDYIDRKVEEQAACVTADVGVNAEVLFFDSSNGLQLSRFLDGATVMDAESFHDLGAVARAGHSFRLVHECGQRFLTTFDVFNMIDEYQELLQRDDAPLPDGYNELLQETEVVRKALTSRPAPLKPCHCDPLAENFLDSGTHMYIIDWEYAGNNDPMWDLGDLSVEAGFNEEQDQALMDAYFQGPVPDDMYGRMVMYKTMCDLLWTLWGVIQHVKENPAEDFWAYAVNRCERCRTSMAHGDFGRHLDAVSGADP